MSLNRWVFKWRLNVETLSHSLMSAGKEFQMDGAATEKARRTSSVCVRRTTSSGAKYRIKLDEMVSYFSMVTLCVLLMRCSSDAVDSSGTGAETEEKFPTRLAALNCTLHYITRN